MALIRGISLEKAINISEEYKKQFGIRDLMLLLAPYEVSMEYCIKIYQVLGTDAGEKIKENPYVLCRNEIGFPFERVEKIAFDFGISPDNELRISSGIEYILRKNLLNATHVFHEIN